MNAHSLVALSIDPGAYYSEQTLRIHGLDGDVLRRARNDGELRHFEHGAIRLYKGAWLLDWLEGKHVRTGRLHSRPSPV